MTSYLRKYPAQASESRVQTQQAAEVIVRSRIPNRTKGKLPFYDGELISACHGPAREGQTKIMIWFSDEAWTLWSQRMLLYQYKLEAQSTF